MVLNKKDATQIIKSYFEKTEINSKVRWDEAARLLGPDAPHEALKVLSTGEKRQLWSEYQSQSKRRKRGKERQARSESIASYRNSLSEWVIENQGCNRVLLFRDFAKDHHKSTWWNNIDDKEKDEIFQEIVEEHEKQFLDSIKPNYNENVEKLFELLKLDSEIFPSFELNKVGDSMNNSIEYEKRGNFSAFCIWENIQRKYYKDELFRKVYKRDILDLYLGLLKERNNHYKQEHLKTELKFCKYRMAFWDIILNDILTGKIGPITKNRRSHFFTNSKISDERIWNLCTLVSKRVKYQRSDRYFKYFEDFLKFIGFHLSIKKDKKIILALLKHPINGGTNLYCIDMLEYIIYLLQKLYDLIISELNTYFKSSENIQVSFQQFKEISYKNQNIMDFKTRYNFPFSFESVLDTVLYRAYCDDFGHYSLGSSRGYANKTNSLENSK
ncbi:FF domain-containing protein [Cryptosporidium canis]|uniref:FF domain-containing protein n=1 Tax=Cryptosporidium canis TaxID=195482 RepID=A0ABQ8PAM1_9CRYT|nr:FF domain-containing protein [Cryptosporidium canis]